jgi:hypothetical protein
MEIESKHSELDYLAEYLIENKGITLHEAKYLITLIEDEKQSLFKKIKDSTTKKISSLKDWKNKQKEKARAKYKGSVLKAELKAINAKYAKNLDKIKAEAQKKGKNIFSRTGRMKSVVKASFRTFPKTSKIGGTAAGTAAALGGLAAYSAKKKRKEALKK